MRFSRKIAKTHQHLKKYHEPRYPDKLFREFQVNLRIACLRYYIRQWTTLTIDHGIWEGDTRN